MEELKNSGLYSKLDNQNLKNLLNKYYSELKWFFEQDEFSVNRPVDEFRNYVVNNYNLTIRDIPFITNSLEVIKKDPGFIVRLREVEANARWIIYGAETSKNRTKLLLDEIQAEIDGL